MLIAFHKNALMCFQKTRKIINEDCLPILMLLHIMPVYLMLFVALPNSVCLLLVDFFIAINFCFHALSWFIDT